MTTTRRELWRENLWSRLVAEPAVGVLTRDSDGLITWEAGGPGGLVLGTTAGTACEGNDARLSDARTPTAHASSHVTGGSDVIATFGASASGLVPASGGGTTNFLRADGSFAAPPGGGGPAAQLDANGTTLDVDAITDGSILRRTGATVVGATCTAAGYALLDDADAAAQRTTLGLGTAATTATTAYEAAGGIATHAALTTVHGISAFGATLVDDADATAARTTLGLGTAATTASTAYEAAGAVAAHASAGDPHPGYALESGLAAVATSGSASDLGSGTVAVARLPTMTATVAGIVPTPPNNTTTFLRGDGTFATPSGGGGGPSVALKAADQTFNSATPAAVTDLSFALTANRRYRFHFVLACRSNTLTVGVGITVTAPASTVLAYTVRAGGIAADGTAGELQGAGTSSGDAVLGTAVVAINTDYIYEVVGIIEPTAGGTLQLNARTETGTTVVTVRRASVGYLWDNG